MEPTICPWCQTEIVWDEEIGPEEECPHCHNELKGYRTINIALGEEEEEELPDSGAEYDAFRRDEVRQEADDLWDQEEPRREGLTRRPAVSGESAPDLMAYEAAVAAVQETQEQLPECPHCRQYMLHAGKQAVSEADIKEHIPFGLSRGLLSGPVELNLYVCPACFHTSTFLSEQDRLKFVRNVQKSNS